jgi:hypothetical protein
MSTRPAQHELAMEGMSFACKLLTTIGSQAIPDHRRCLAILSAVSCEARMDPVDENAPCR